MAQDDFGISDEELELLMERTQSVKEEEYEDPDLVVCSICGAPLMLGYCYHCDRPY